MIVPIQSNPCLPTVLPYSDKQLVLTGDHFQAMINFLKSSPALVFDFETSGLEYFKHASACGIALAGWDRSTSNLYNFYVPFRHQTGEPQLDLSLISPAIRELLGNESQIKVAHNLKFDEHMARKEGWAVKGPRYDTMIAARLFDENRRVALKYRALTDLNRSDADYWETLLNKQVSALAAAAKMKVGQYRSLFGYSQIFTYYAGAYACFDVEFTAGLYCKYENLNLSNYYKRIWQTEMNLTEVLCDMEEFGLPIDVEYLEQLRSVLRKSQKQLSFQIDRYLSGRSFNLNSEDELRTFLQRDLGIKLTKTTKTGRLAVDNTVLEFFSDLYPVLRLIMKWREAEKLVSTYTTSILDRLDVNNILHPDFNQVGTNTGRFSAKNPNLQNQPGDSNARAKEFSGKGLEDGGIDPWSIRRAFVNRGKGWVRLFFDYSQIELRVLAYYSQDPIMVKAFLEGEDIHTRTSLEVFNRKDKDSRSMAKRINFGLSYGMTAKGLSRQIKRSENEAEDYLRKFDERYSGIDNFRRSLFNYIRNNKCQFRNLFGRTRRIPKIVSDKGYERGRSERQAIATIVQGTAAEIMKESMVRTWKMFKAENLPAHLVVTVHDEQQVDSHTSILSYIVPKIKTLMEDYPEFAPIPIVVDGEYSTTSWADKKPLPIGGI